MKKLIRVDRTQNLLYWDCSKCERFHQFMIGIDLPTEMRCECGHEYNLLQIVEDTAKNAKILIEE